MCNLGQGIEERGIEKGIEQGIEQGIERGMEQGIEQGMARGEAKIILSMYKNGFKAEQIAAATDKSIAEVEAILAGKESVNG